MAKSKLAKLNKKISTPKRTKAAIAADKNVKAMHPGKRVSESGNEYHESRPNRSDVNRTKKFESGGSVGDKKVHFGKSRNKIVLISDRTKDLWANEYFKDVQEAKDFVIQNGLVLTSETVVDFKKKYSDGGKPLGSTGLFAKGGGMKDYDAFFEKLTSDGSLMLEELVEDANGFGYESHTGVTTENVETKSYPGFIPFTDGGASLKWFEYANYLLGSGKRLPTNTLQKFLEKMDDDSFRNAVDKFKEEYPEIFEELGEDAINYHDLYEKGYTTEAEEMDEWRHEYMGDESIMFELGFWLYEPSNSRAVDNNPTCYVFGVVNMEAPYHRRGKFEDFIEEIFTFKNEKDFKEKLEKALSKVKDWFEGGSYDAGRELKFEWGGEAVSSGDVTQPVFAKGGKVNPQQMSKVIREIPGNENYPKRIVIAGVTDDGSILMLNIDNGIRHGNKRPYFSMTGDEVVPYTMAAARRYAKDYWQTFFEDEPEQMTDMNERMGTKFRSPSSAANYVLETDGELHGFDQNRYLGEMKIAGKDYIFQDIGGGQNRDSFNKLSVKYLSDDLLERLMNLWDNYHLEEVGRDVMIPVIEQDEDVIMAHAIGVISKKNYSDGGKPLGSTGLFANGGQTGKFKVGDKVIIVNSNGVYDGQKGTVLEVFNEREELDVATDYIPEGILVRFEDVIHDVKGGSPGKVYTFSSYEERGEWTIDVNDPVTNETKWDYRFDGSDEDQSSIIEDGFMKHMDDISGLEKYLKQQGVLNEEDELVDIDDYEEPEEDDENDFENGGKPLGSTGLFAKGGRMGSLIDKAFVVEYNYKYFVCYNSPQSYSKRFPFTNCFSVQSAKSLFDFFKNNAILGFRNYMELYQYFLDNNSLLTSEYNDEELLFIDQNGQISTDVFAKGGRTKAAIAADKNVKALHPGKRISEDGNEYYENRPNRSDVNRTKKFDDGGKPLGSTGLFAKGGKMKDGKSYRATELSISKVGELVYSVDSGSDKRITHEVYEYDGKYFHVLRMKGYALSFPNKIVLWSNKEKAIDEADSSAAIFQGGGKPLGSTGLFEDGGTVPDFDNRDSYDDYHAAMEVELFAENSADLYRQRWIPILKNLKKKKDKGAFDVNKAAVLMKYYVEDADKKYQKEFGNRNATGFMLSVKDRKLLSKKLAHHVADMSDGDMTFSNGGKLDQRVDTVLSHYIAAALWSSIDDDDQPMDISHSRSDIDEKTLAGMRADVKKFLEDNKDIIAESGMDDEQLGHDFWLTRHGHGTGFWDRDLPGDTGDLLSKAANKFKETDLYIGYDGKVHGLGYFENGGNVSYAELPNEFKHGGPLRIPNNEANQYSENRIPFRGNNLEGKELDNGDYVVLSYGYYPVWYWCKMDGKWYGSSDKFSATTSKQITQSRPAWDSIMLTHSELLEKMKSQDEKFDLGGTMIRIVNPMSVDNTLGAHGGSAINSQNVV